jgi:hypothetical protein
MVGQLFRNISRLYVTFDEKGKVVKSVQPIKTPVRTLTLPHIFKSVVFGKDGKGISFKNRLKGHINWRKVRHFNVI